MSEEEKKAVELIKKQIDFCKNNTECREELNQCFGCTIEVEDVNALEIILNLIEKQSKMVDLMAENLTTPTHDKEWVIKYFEEEVELEDGN